MFGIIKLCYVNLLREKAYDIASEIYKEYVKFNTHSHYVQCTMDTKDEFYETRQFSSIPYQFRLHYTMIHVFGYLFRDIPGSTGGYYAMMDLYWNSMWSKIDDNVYIFKGFPSPADLYSEIFELNKDGNYGKYYYEGFVGYWDRNIRMLGNYDTYDLWLMGADTDTWIIPKDSIILKVPGYKPKPKSKLIHRGISSTQILDSIREYQINVSMNDDY